MTFACRLRPENNGDITLTPYGAYRIEDGAMAFERSIEPQL